MSSLKIAHALLAPETQKALSLPMAALIVGVVSQVESANRTRGPSLRPGISPLYQDHD